jgi:PAS domain S-box-containing protein
MWVSGCSGGQEVYSIAMALAEVAGPAFRTLKLQIFATDASEAQLAKARSGLFAPSQMADLPPEETNRFFFQEAGRYRATKALRAPIVFARHAVWKDPPFSRMDLISCRNLLGDLRPALQEKVLAVFHYALKPKGILLLGEFRAETAALAALFDAVDRKGGVFRKRKGANVWHASEAPVRQEPQPWEEHSTELKAQDEVARLALSRYAPPSVLVDAQLCVLQHKGDITPYLKPGPRQGTLQLLKMARRGLRPPLQAAIAEAKTEGRPVRQERVRVSRNGQTRLVNLELVPLTRLKRPCYAIFFEAATGGEGRTAHGSVTQLRHERKPHTGRPRNKPEARGDAADPHELGMLREELTATKEQFESMREAYEAAHEELQSSNEEVVASNEELQSTNEQLETSKEEMESRNEELLSINDELASRNEELDRLNSDLKNLHTSLHTAIIVLNRDLSVRSFTPAAKHSFHLAASDIGRPLSRVRHGLELSNLEELLGEVVASVEQREQEVRTRDGRWYSLRARPYVNVNDQVDGVVLMLVDIDALKRGEARIAAARDFAETILQTTGYPFVVLREDLRVETANAAFYNTFKVAPAETVGRAFYELGNGQWNIPKLREFMEASDTTMEQLEVTGDFEHIGHRTMLLNAHRMMSGGAAPKRVLLAINDVSEGKQWEAVRRSEARYRRLFEAAKDGVLIVDPVTSQVTEANPAMAELLGYAREELLGKELEAIGLFPNRTACGAALRQLRETGIYRGDQLAGKTKTGEHRDFEVLGNVYEEESRQVIQCNIRDVTQRRQAEADLRQAKNRLAGQARELEQTVAERTAALRETMADLESFSYSIAHDLRAPLRAMQSFGSILEDEARDQLSDQGKDCLRRIVTAAQRMDQLIQDVLNYSRVVRAEIPLTRVNVERLLRGILESYLHLQPPAADISLQGPFPDVVANEATLTLCLSNLLGNAVKFVPAGVKPLVRVWAESNNGRVRLFFADNGIGIPKEQQNRIFEMFQRLHRTYEGTGIGLAIVKKSMERMRGSVGLQSELGKGSTFWLELARAE